MENDFFKDFGQKWKVRNGTVVFQKVFVNRGLTTAVFRSRGTMVEMLSSALSNHAALQGNEKIRER